MKQMTLALTLAAVALSAAPASAFNANILIPTLTFPTASDADTPRTDRSTDDLRGQLLTATPKEQ